MKTHLELVVLRVTKYNDKKSILTAYALQHGRIAFAIPAGNGRETIRRKALFMPLALTECVADIRPGRDIHTLSEPRAIIPLLNNYRHPIKNALCMFLSEVLLNVVREPISDPAIWEFISRSIVLLDSLPSTHTSNYHICFMLGLAQLLGISPDESSYKPGYVFDMVDAIFRPSTPMHSDYLIGEESDVVHTLLRLKYHNMHKFKASRTERNRILDSILHYYTLHYTSMSNLKTLDVLRALF